MGFSLDHRSLKIGALDVEKSFTCCWLLKLWQEVVNLKNEVDKKEVARLFGESFIPQATSFCALKMWVVYKCRMDTLNFQWLLQNW